MKIKYILSLMIVVGLISSCAKKDFSDLNIDTKNPVVVPGEFLFANAQKALADQVASTNVNLNNFKLFAQYWTETTYTDESNYDIVNRTVADFTWRTYYRDVLVDLKEAKKLIEAAPADGDAALAEQKNKMLIADLLMVYAYNRLVDMFGDIPYSEALDIDNISPVYDNAFTIYKDLIAKTDAAISGLDNAYGSYGASDLYFGGDVSMWIKFANTLKIKMGVTISTQDMGLATATVESAVGKGFEVGESCYLAYEGGTNSNPLYQDLIQSGRDDFVPANTIVDLMNSLNDPRRQVYFTELDGEYIGGDYGYSNSFPNFSHIPNTARDYPAGADIEGTNISDATFPMVLLNSIEQSFYLAEAAERGMSVGGSAAEWYSKGIEESIQSWLAPHTTRFSADDVQQAIDGYLAQSDVAYGSAPGDWKQKIGSQAWIAFYGRGMTGWTSYRRLGYPTMNIPPNPAESAQGAVPRRMTYPINEQTLNADNYYSASDAIGGDLLATKLFWDK